MSEMTRVLEELDEANEKIKRLTSRGIEDMRYQLDLQKKYLLESSAQITGLQASLVYLLDAINCDTEDATDWVDTAEREAKVMLAKTPAQSLAMVRAEALRDAANTCCPVSGYIIRDERSRSDLVSWAQMVENDIDIEPPTPTDYANKIQEGK